MVDFDPPLVAWLVSSANFSFAALGGLGKFEFSWARQVPNGRSGGGSRRGAAR